MKYAFVLLVASCSLSAVHAQWLETTIPVGQIPCALCYNAQNDKVYVASEGSSKVTVINGATNEVIARVAAGNGVGLCYNQTNNRVYCADLGPDVVSVVDGATDSVIANVHVGTISVNLCYNYLDNKVYCARFGGYGVTVIDGATNEVLAQVPTPYQAMGELCFNTRDDKVYCTSSDSIGYVTIIDGKTDSSSHTELGRGVSPTALCYNVVQNRIFCADEAYGSVIVIDGVTDTVIGAVTVGQWPSALCYDSSMDRIYCANVGTDNVSVIDAGSNLVIATVATGHEPRAILHDSAHDKVFCANSGSDGVAVIDCATDSVICTIATGQFPNALVRNPLRNRVYVTNRDDSSVSVLRDSGTGIQETTNDRRIARKVSPTILSGASGVKRLGSCVVFDAMGRRVLDPRPGVFFVAEPSAVGRKPSAVTKVVIAR